MKLVERVAPTSRPTFSAPDVGRDGVARENYTIAQASRLLRVELDQLRREIAAGALETYQHGDGRQRITQCELFFFAIFRGYSTARLGAA